MVCLIRQSRIDIFDISPLFRGQAADEIFRVAAWARLDWTYADTLYVVWTQLRSYPA